MAMFSRYGAPDLVVTDNCPVRKTKWFFSNKVFKFAGLFHIAILETL